MIRLIIRHGKAEPYSRSGSDDDRALTGRGHAQAAFLGERLGGSDFAPSRIISSPILRAHQTATAIAEALGAGVEIDEALSTHACSDAARELLEEVDDAESVALVGHNPTLSILASEKSTGGSVSLKTGMCAVIELSSPVERGKLIELIRLPKHGA